MTATQKDWAKYADAMEIKVAVLLNVLDAAKAMLAFLDRNFDGTYEGKNLEDFLPALRVAVAKATGGVDA